jgi:hypothetical protein
MRRTKIEFDQGRTITKKTISLAELRKAFRIPDDADVELVQDDKSAFSLAERTELRFRWERIS